MTLEPGSAAELLKKARGLNEARAYPALATLLEPWTRDELAVEPELLFLRADVGRRLGRSDAARTDLDRLAAELGRHGNVALHRRRLNLLGSLAFEAGRIDEARDAWLTQLDDATEAGDEEFVARACNNLGVVSTLMDELPVALGYYTRAIGAYRTVGYERGLGQAHHNMAIIYREMGFLIEADAHFRQAERFAQAARSIDEGARVDQERALLLYLQGDAPLARHVANRALGTYGELEDPVGRAEVLRIQGLIALGEGDFPDAESLLSQAASEAARLSSVLLEAESLSARAALFKAQARLPDGEVDEARSRELFEAIGAPGWGSRSRDRASVLAARGSAASSRSR